MRRVENGPDLHLEPRALHERAEDGDGDIGYLYINTARAMDFPT